MALTTTSGYTFPVVGAPTTQNPGGSGSGTIVGSSSTSSAPDKSNYSAWNGDWLGYLKYQADHGDPTALDRLLDYFMSEQSSQNARDWTAQREDTQYQRLVKDMKAAGLNPYAFATMGASPISSSSSGHTYSGQFASSYEINKEKNQQNWLKVALSAALPIIGAAIAAML